MDPHWKEVWLEALKSGRYQKGQGALYVYGDDDPDEVCKPVAYCCLGVLADICPLVVAEDDGQLTEDSLALIGITKAQQNTLIGLNDDEYVHSDDEEAEWDEWAQEEVYPDGHLATWEEGVIPYIERHL